ncbi:MAG: eCIS core domain-containing protein [Kofleriaceae bacterium]
MRAPTKQPSLVSAPKAGDKKPSAMRRAVLPTPGVRHSVRDVPVSSPDGDARRVAERGFRGPAQPLPFRGRIEAALGRDLSGIRAYIGGPAASASEQLQAHAFTAGSRIAFREPPNVALATHEAVHALQHGSGAPTTSGVSRPGDASERAAEAIASRVASGGAAAGLLAAMPTKATVAAVQRQAAPQQTPEDYYLSIVQFLETEWQGRPPGLDRAKAYRLHLLVNALRPESFATTGEVDAFVTMCKKIADDEQKSWAALQQAGADDDYFIREGEAFPTLWGDRVSRELYGTSNETVLADRYAAAKKNALANTATISDEVWERGLPLSLAQAAQFRRDQIPDLALDYRYAKQHPKEAIGRYALLLITWERTLAHYLLVRAFRWQLANHVNEIRQGEIVIDDATYKDVLGARFFHWKLGIFESAASTPDDVRSAMTALLLQHPTKFFRDGLGGGLKYKWPDEGVAALWNEIREVDSQLEAAGRDQRIWRAMVWAYERGYFGDAAIEAYHAIKNDWLKMIGTAAAILIAQAIPGINVALDIVLLIEFGVDVLRTILDLSDTFTSAAAAVTVDQMQRASVKMASSLVGIGAKILIWAATWGLRATASKVNKWREGKKFLDEEGHSPEAREALKNAKGDPEAARKSLDAKRAQERAAAAKKAEEEAAAAAKAKREQEAAAAAKAKLEQELAAAAKAKREYEAAARKQREQEEAAANAKREQEAEAQRNSARRKQEEDANRKPAEASKGKKKNKTEEEGKFPCFVAGTRVLTPEGSRAIEDIHVGDLVLAQHPDDRGWPEPRRVTATHVSSSNQLVLVGSVQATRRHRFWTTRGWVRASDLAGTDVLSGPGGVPVTAELGTAEAPSEVETFNLTVADVSTYFVVIGATAVLVHNAGDLPPFDQPLYWVFGKTIDVRPTDSDGKSVWRTNNRDEVNRLFQIRVENGRSKGDPHLWFTEEQARAANLKLNQSPAHVVPTPSTPGEHTTAALVQNKIDHYSLRPTEARDIPHGISYDELQQRKDLHLTEKQMSDLTERTGKVGAQEMKPRVLKC